MLEESRGGLFFPFNDSGSLRLRGDFRRGGIGTWGGRLQCREMGYGNLPILAVTELDCRQAGRYFQHLAGAPFKCARVAYNAANFDCH